MRNKCRMGNVLMLGDHQRQAMPFKSKARPAIGVYDVRSGGSHDPLQKPGHQLEAVVEPLYARIMPGPPQALR